MSMKKYIAISIFLSLIASCQKEYIGVLPTSETPIPDLDKFYTGADLSYVNQIEDKGGTYSDGAETDPFTIFKNHGCNIVRARLWHNPSWHQQTPVNYPSGNMYSHLPDVIKTLRRAKTLGMATVLDLHYSDKWADPKTQQIPAAWTDLNLTTLSDSVYQYTKKVLTQLNDQSLTPEFIQLGNEINPGFLFPKGKIDYANASGWKDFGTLLSSAIKAVRDFSSTATIKPKIIIHITKLANLEFFFWYLMKDVKGPQLTDFDIIGISNYYFDPSDATNLVALEGIDVTIKNMKAKYNKHIMIMETAYPWTSGNYDNTYKTDPSNVFTGKEVLTNYPINALGQYQYMTDLCKKVKAGGGSGVIYWEPAWIHAPNMYDMFSSERIPGSRWENCAFFDFRGKLNYYEDINNNRNLYPIDFMKNTY